MSHRNRPAALALALPLASLAACGGGNALETAALGQANPGTSQSGPVGTALDGLTIRQVGLVRFDVTSAALDFGYADAFGDEQFGMSSGDRTTARAAFATFDRPLDDRTLSRIAGLTGAAGVNGCYAIRDARSGLVDALLDSADARVSAGEVLTVSGPSGSRFELRGDDYGGDVSYEMSSGQGAYPDPSVPYPSTAYDPFASFGSEGGVESGTTVDVPGDAFPAFPAVDVPAMAGLSDVVHGDGGVIWTPGTDPSVPMVIDVRFDDYVTLDGFGGRADSDGFLTDSDSFGDIRVLVEAPTDMRCITGDTGRFVYPAALRETMDRFRAAGRAVADRIPPGSDLDAENRGDAGDDGSLTDFDTVEVSGGRSVSASRVATRYRVEGNALLIVRSTNGGTL